MPYYQQCLLFLVEEERPTTGSRATNSASCRSSSEPLRSLFALLPRVFLVQHPNLLRTFRSNDVIVVDETNVTRLFVDGGKVTGYEIILHTHLSASADPMEVVAPNQFRELFLNVLGDNIRVSDARPRKEFVGSVLDDSTTAVLKLVAGRRPEIPVYFSHLEVLVAFGSLLHLAASRGDVELARLLAQAGGDVNSKFGMFDCPPLYHALYNSRSPEMTRFLIELGADPNDSGHHELPLNWAIAAAQPSNTVNMADYLAVIKTMLDFEAMFNVGGPAGMVLKCTILESEPEVFQYFLERCFIRGQSLEEDPIFEMLGRSYGATQEVRQRCERVFHIFGRHLQKIDTLEKHLNPNAPYNLVNRLSAVAEFPDLPNLNFAEGCEAEIGELENRKLGDADVSLLELLGKKEKEVACLLRNKSDDDIAKFHKWSSLFPIYGNILDYHLAKGAFRKSIQEDAIESCGLLSQRFLNLPEELQEMVVSYLCLRDVLSLKRAANRSENSS